MDETRKVYPDYQVGRGILGHQKATLVFDTDVMVVAFWNRKAAKMARGELEDGGQKRSIVDMVDDMMSLPYRAVERYRTRPLLEIVAEEADNRFVADSAVTKVTVERRGVPASDPSYECKIYAEPRPVSILLGKTPDEQLLSYLKTRYGDRCRF